MKEEALKAHEEVVKGADVALYDAGFADGQAQAQSSGITQDQMDAAVNEAKASGLAEGEKSGFEKGAASVPVASPDGKFTQEEMDKYSQSKIDQLPADITPYGQADMDKVNSELALAKSELEKVTSDDESDKAAIAEGLSKLDAIAAILAPKAKA